MGGNAGRHTAYESAADLRPSYVRKLRGPVLCARIRYKTRVTHALPTLNVRERIRTCRVRQALKARGRFRRCASLSPNGASLSRERSFRNGRRNSVISFPFPIRGFISRKQRRSYISANFSLSNRILSIIRAVRNGGSLLIQLYVNLIEESKVVQLATWGGERKRERKRV